jgi:two-component system response regulator AtoC
MARSNSVSGLNIFLLEDDKWYNTFLTHHLTLNPDNIVESFFTVNDLLKNLFKNPDIIVLDYSLPDGNGASVLKKIKEFNPNINVLIVSGQEDIATVVDLLKQGAADYIIKNDETKERLWASISNIRDKIALKEEISELKNELKTQYDFSESMIGTSKSIKSISAIIEKACSSNITVSIHGETGTGKEVVAKVIHYNSARKKGKFIAVNVASIPGELIESELFGHEKGAFTGAVARRIGRFEEANNGTLFLDEIAEMDLNMQVKLLRVLQERELTRVGGNELVKFDARILVATHKDLAEEVKKGNFREDLYYRILGLMIELPPLRERESDIILLAKHFIKLYCKDNKVNLIKLSTEAQNKLMDYHYPGNIRELKSIIDLACVMSENELIEADTIKYMKSGNAQDIFLKEMTLDEYTERIIMNYLEKYNNNVLLVAKKLSVGKSTIYRMLKDNATDANHSKN